MAGEAPQSDPDFNLIRNVVMPDAKKQPDRYVAIVMAAIMEEELGEILQARLVDHKKTAKKMFGGMGPLATFSAKIDLAFLLGMYREDFAKMLHAVRDIRNTFAHDLRPLTFASDEVKAKAIPLKFIETFDLRPKSRTERDLFINACEFILGGMGALAMEKRRFKTPVAGKKASLRAS